MTIALTKEAWQAAGEERYGADKMVWRFRCPSCGHIATPRQWHDAGAPEGTFAFSCIGRWTGGDVGEMCGTKQPCNYAGGGLFKINPIHIDDGSGKEPYQVFDFADRPLEVKP